MAAQVVRQPGSEASKPKFDGSESAGCVGAATAGVRRRASIEFIYSSVIEVRAGRQNVSLRRVPQVRSGRGGWDRRGECGDSGAGFSESAWEVVGSGDPGMKRALPLRVGRKRVGRRNCVRLRNGRGFLRRRGCCGGFECFQWVVGFVWLIFVGFGEGRVGLRGFGDEWVPDRVG